MNTNAIVDKTSIRPGSWNNEIASNYEVGKVIDTSEYTIENFINIPMYVAWTAVCECCNNPVRQCKLNVSINWKAEDWSNYLKKIVPVPQQLDEDGEVVYVPKVYAPKTGQRGRAKTTRDLTPEIIDEAETLFKEIGLVATSKKLNVNPSLLSVALKERNIVISKGKKKVIASIN